LELALNRRGVFFKKLAVSDLEFFEARAAGLPTRGFSLAINAPIAEAALPRAAQRCGYWKIEGRQYPAGKVELFELHRAVDWQLSGPGTDDPLPPAGIGDWFAAQYETAAEGQVSLQWRLITRARHRVLWGEIQEAMHRHLVARMAHFSDVHPEYETIGRMLDRSDAAEEETEFGGHDTDHERKPPPAADGDFSDRTRRLSGGALVQYADYQPSTNYQPNTPIMPARLAPPPLLPANELGPATPGRPTPRADSLLKLARALRPILVTEIPVAREREEARAAQERTEEQQAAEQAAAAQERTEEQQAAEQAAAAQERTEEQLAPEQADAAQERTEEQPAPEPTPAMQEHAEQRLLLTRDEQRDAEQRDEQQLVLAHHGQQRPELLGAPEQQRAPVRAEQPRLPDQQRAPDQQPPVARAEAPSAPVQSGNNHWLRTASASVLGLLLLGALGLRNTETLSGLVCDRVGVHCAPREIINDARAPLALPPDERPKQTANVPAPEPQVEEPATTASIPAASAPEPAASKPADTTAPARAPYVDEVVWRFLEDTRNSDQLKSFLTQFPTSPYRIPALTRLAAIEPKVTECDLLAAHPLDQLRSPEVTGVSIQLLNSILATHACEHAVADYPEAPRFPLQLGRGYEKAKRYEEAHRWYARGADLGNAQAMHNLGFQFATGQGVRRDYAEARKWFARAAALGNAAAMVRMGELYANGYGVPRDYGEAGRWFLQAADRGIPLAMSHLGDLYANGRGARRDYAEARAWYRKAAQLGSAAAMYNLALLNEQGRGGPRDYGEARRWYTKAADIGDEEARRSLARLRR